ALLFWGWQTGFLILALPLAVLVEAARALTWRLELSATDFHRLTDLCTLLIVVSGIYLFSTTGTSRATDGPRAMTLLFQWLPLLAMPATSRCIGPSRSSNRPCSSTSSAWSAATRTRSG